MKNLCVLILVACVFSTGCAIKTPVHITTDISGPGLPKPASECVALVVALASLDVNEDVWTGRAWYEIDPNRRLQDFADRISVLGIFKEIRKPRRLPKQQPPDLYIVGFNFYDPGPSFWRTVQVFDLFIHTLVLPTLPYYRRKQFTLYVYDKEGLDKDKEEHAFKHFLRRYSVTTEWGYFVGAFPVIYGGLDIYYGFGPRRQCESRCYELMQEDLTGGN